MMIKLGDKVRVVDPDDKYYGCEGLVQWTNFDYPVDGECSAKLGVVLHAGDGRTEYQTFDESQLETRYQFGDKFFAKVSELGESNTCFSDSSQKGQQSQLNARYDLIPPTALKTVAEVLGEGETKYPAIDGIPNWHYITTEDHLNHALAHIYAYLSDADTGEDDLSHAATRLLLALEIDRIGVKQK